LPLDSPSAASRPTASVGKDAPLRFLARDRFRPARRAKTRRPATDVRAAPERARTISAHAAAEVAAGRGRTRQLAGLGIAHRDQNPLCEGAPPGLGLGEGAWSKPGERA